MREHGIILFPLCPRNICDELFVSVTAVTVLYVQETKLFPLSVSDLLVKRWRYLCSCVEVVLPATELHTFPYITRCTYHGEKKKKKTGEPLESL